MRPMTAGRSVASRGGSFVAPKMLSKGPMAFDMMGAMEEHAPMPDDDDDDLQELFEDSNEVSR